MGANLSSTFRRSTSKGRQPKAVSSHNYHSNITSAGSSIIELMKPERRLKTKKTMKKKISNVRDQFTLEELLMASPRRSSSYKRVHPSSSRVVQTAPSSFSMEKSTVHLDHKGCRTALSCKARDSFSLEKRVRGDHEEERPKVSSIISRSESGNSEKKVRFRLPEETDIVIFHSPAGQ